MNEHIEIFSELRPQYEKFRTKLEELISDLISETNLEMLSIESRTKSIESFNEKIKRPGKNYTNPISEITDLCGIRIITYYTEDIYKIAELIEKEFDVDFENSVDKTKVESPDKFGYQSMHYIIKLNKNRSKLIEWKAFKNFQVELQIRTILQHSWSAIDHKIRYKSKGEIPPELKRKIFRLSALLELADEEFLSIKNQTIVFSENVEKSIDTGNLDLKFNVISLASYFANNEKINLIVNTALKLGFLNPKFEDDDAEYYFFNRLIDVLTTTKMKTIKDLDNFLNLDIKIVEKNLKTFINDFNKEDEKFHAVSQDLIIILLILNKQIVTSLEELYNMIKWGAFNRTIERIMKN